MLLMIENNGENKLFLLSNSKGSRVKHSLNQSHNFTGVYPSPVLMKLDARKFNILSCLFLKNTVEAIFLLFSNF